jgi:gliding motility-associated-like protein
MIASGGGIVMLAMKRTTPAQVMMMKMDYNGQVLWANSYEFPNVTTIDIFNYAQHQLIEAGDHLIFAAFGNTTDARGEMLIVRADLDGHVNSPCVNVVAINVPVITVSNPVFYPITPSTPMASLTQANTSPGPTAAGIMANEDCFVADTVMETITASICPGESYEGYTTSGTYIDHFVTALGCDSVRLLLLTSEEAITTQVDQSICFGESVEGYTENGVYIDSFTAISGCDSIRTLHLTVGLIEQTLMVQICSGESFEDYTEPGTYQDTIRATQGSCDTIRTLVLAVTHAVETTIDRIGCHGQTHEGYTQSGVYTDTLTSVSGCDSVRVLHLQLLDETYGAEILAVCDPANTYGNQPGTYTDTLVSSWGCDSILTIAVEGSKLFIPNVFSPNHDGINDVFTIDVYPQLDLTLEYFAIFDRFGDMTYETSEWPVVWKGEDADGKPYQPGVFAYVFIYRCGNEKIVEQGNITLIK